MTAATHFTEITPETVERIPTGNRGLDYLYGDGGMPRKVMALWAGSKGVGKTRTTVEVCKQLLKAGRTVLYFTLEMTKPQFHERYCQKMDRRFKFYLSEAKSLADQMTVIRDCRPDLIVVDSATVIKEYNNGRGADAIQDAYRNVIQETNSHVIFIGHLNTSGGVKGGTYLPHMVDIEFLIHKLDKEMTTPFFIIACPDKNRYAPTGRETVWMHKEHGVEFQKRDIDVASAVKPNTVRTRITERRGSKHGFFERLFG